MVGGAPTAVDVQGDPIPRCGRGGVAEGPEQGGVEPGHTGVLVVEQQRFAANASHELRTPLAVTQTLLDVAREDPEGDPGELVERLHLVNSRAIDLTEALLVLSRANQRTFTPEDVDLSLLAEDATETLLPLAEARRVSIRTSGEVAVTVGSPTLLLQMTTNLLHNAIVHNLSDGGTVHVTTARGDGIVLTVENTGARVAAPTMPRSRSPSSAAPSASVATMPGSVSAWRSSRASPTPTTGPSRSSPAPRAGSAPRCTCRARRRPHRPRPQVVRGRHDREAPRRGPAGAP